MLLLDKPYMLFIQIPQLDRVIQGGSKETIGLGLININCSHCVCVSIELELVAQYLGLIDLCISAGVVDFEVCNEG
jgi:hypothetical protein